MRDDDRGGTVTRMYYIQQDPCYRSLDLVTFGNGVSANNTNRLSALLWLPCYFANNLSDTCHSMKYSVGSGTVVYGYVGATYHMPYDHGSGRHAHWGTEQGASLSSTTLP
jgi:hypothetical protein